MLISPRGEERLPRGVQAYTAFRIAAQYNFVQMDGAIEIEGPAGFLAAVGLLEMVPVDVQLELLAETWARHRRPQPVWATLLDAAILYAACETAADLIESVPDLALNLLEHGPRRAAFTAATPGRLRLLFEAFWDDQEWKLVELAQDTGPEQRRELMAVLGVDDDEVQTLFEALARGKVSPALADNLRGLLTPEEITAYLEVVRRLHE